MKLFRFLIVLTLFLFVAVNVQAAGAKPYVGGKIGLMKPDGGGADDAVNVGVLLGLELHEIPAGSVAIEGELTTTVISGDIGSNGEWDVTTLAGYGVFRTAGTAFFKGKLGLVYWDADVDGLGGGSDDDIDLSFGIGGGYKVSDKASLELEYTIIESDLDFLSVGFTMSF